MTDRNQIERLIRDLHDARVRGDLAGMCKVFADDGSFRIAGASDGKPISINASGLGQFKPWLAMMVKAFRLSEYALLSLTIEDERGAAHWSAQIHSKITGVTIPTELIDMFQVRDGRIARYTELFVPR